MVDLSQEIDVEKKFYNVETLDFFLSDCKWVGLFAIQ